MKKAVKKVKVCCICGQNAGKWEQWHDRDTGFGICPPCAKKESSRSLPEEMKSFYGVEGQHYSKEE